MSRQKDVKQLIQRIEAAGCTVVMTRGGHWKVLLPNGGLYFMAKSPSDSRSIANAIAGLRQKGVSL